MFSERSMLLGKQTANQRCAEEPGEEIGTVEKLVFVVVSVLVAGGTVLLPFALQNVR